METTYRIPSKKVPYGYLEFTVSEGDGLPDPVKLAEEYAEYIKAYQAAEVQAFEKPATKAKPKQTEDINDEVMKSAVDEIKSQLGATEVDGDDPDAPWNQNGDKSNESPKPEPDDSDWDFG